MASSTLGKGGHAMIVRLFIVASVVAWLSWAPTSVAWGQNATPVVKTWKTVAEFSPTERERIDLSTTTPRHAQFSYLPAELYPFSPPYTAEEMGFRSMEFPHQPRWSCIYADAGATID